MLRSIRRADDTAKKLSHRANALCREKMFGLVLALSGVVDYYITKSPKYLDDFKTEIVMNTSISTKLAALGLALVINSVIMGSVALMFNARLQENPVQTVARVVAEARDAA